MNKAQNHGDELLLFGALRGPRRVISHFVGLKRELGGRVRAQLGTGCPCRLQPEREMGCDPWGSWCRQGAPPPSLPANPSLSAFGQGLRLSGEEDTWLRVRVRPPGGGTNHVRIIQLHHVLRVGPGDDLWLASRSSSSAS